ncbi:two-component regulator propeller domain-containing protein [Geothrix sp. PMB-07]|uniref:ligand-binding sensor domain-containing protein n=1 Tax=Geothrix sp. PMB-07 TaxID=3068640 RepID=UPI0027426292|nr:sensor histidine kinase [Geothrix sp. PMB-07]WLT32415.1 two-component regulator propeller domain-containing protein [Geothrix sp. PMB-07]
MAQGLSQSTVYCSLQDSRGFLWFGTEDGLNRYDGVRFKVFRREEGNPASLGGNWVTSLVEDPHRNLWIGTMAGGINRLDRATERIQRFLPTAPSGGGNPTLDVTAMGLDAEGNLWVGTYGRGLLMAAKDQLGRPQPTFRHFEPTPGRPSDLPGINVHAIFTDSRGDLWIGFQDGGAVRLMRGTAHGTPRFERLDTEDQRLHQSAPTNVNSIAEDDQGVVWVGDDHGLFAWVPGESGWQRHVHRPADKESLGMDVVRRVYRDGAGVIWVGTDGGGLQRMLPRPRPGDQPRFKAFLHDNADASSLAANGVESIMEDASGVLWVGSYVSGLNKLVLNRDEKVVRERHPLSQFRHAPADPTSLNGGAVNAVLVDRRGQLWVGTEGAGLNRGTPRGERLAFERIRASIGQPGALQDEVITTLYEDREGRLWAGSYMGGLIRIEQKAPAGPPRFTHYKNDPKRADSMASNFVECILQDRRGRLWVGTVDGGLHQFHPDKGTFTRVALAPKGEPGTNSVYSMVEDAFGTLWLGTLEGVLRFRPDTGEVRAYRANGRPGSLSHPNAFALHLSPTGVLWIGTNGGGLCRTVIPPWQGPEPTFAHFGTADGLPSNVVESILEDRHGTLWLSTSRALCAFDPEPGRGRNLGWQENHLGNEYVRNASFMTPEGEMFFGGTKGLNVFHPEDLKLNPEPPRLAMTGFQILNQPVPVLTPFRGRTALERSITESPEITLTHGDLVFSLEFAALHYVAPGRNTYTYTMEGLEQGWSEAGERNFVTYSTLPPGQYTLKVRASNCDGQWNPEPLQLRIKVLPPWWGTWWFRLAAGLALVAGVGGLIQYRLRSLRSHNAELEARVAQRTEALAAANQKLLEVDQQRESLTAMLVHDLRSPLTSIHATLDLLEDRGTFDLTAIERCRLASRRMIDMLTDLLDIFRSQERDMVLDCGPIHLPEVLGATYASYQAQAHQKGLALDVDYHWELPLVIGDRAKVERAVANLVGNALKFTPKGGRISISASLDVPEDPRWMEVRVSDTGRGIPKEELPTLFDPYRQIQARDADLGAGLGLAIVKRIMDAHAGEVRVESEEGHGTTFVLRFPLRQENRQSLL